MAISNPITIRRQAGGGGGLPSWVPAPGTFRDVSTNMPTNVNPCPADNCVYSGSSHQNAAFDTWTSGVFAPELGALGSYVTWGGGHLGGSGNEVYRFDLATQLWSRMGNPSPYSPTQSLTSAGAFPDGTPAPPHTYHTLGIRSSANGGGAYGSLISATQPAVDSIGNARTGAWWQFNFATETWSQFINSSGIPAGSITTKTMVQEPGSHFWWFGGGDVSNIHRVTQAGAITSYGLGINTGNDFCGGVIPGTRFLVLRGTFSSEQTWIYNLAQVEAGQTGANARKQISPSGTQGAGSSSLAWNPDVQGFASIVDTSPTQVRWLKPSNPADPWNSSWAWTTETFSAAGGASARSVSTENHGRFVYAPTIKSHIWATLATNRAQAYRPAGT